MVGLTSIVFLASVAGAASEPLRRREQEDAYQLLPYPDTNNTIVNGEAAGGNEFPFYALFEGNTLCGGALIAPNVVVTAAHCIEGGAPLSVRVGGTTRQNGNQASVTDAIIHPEYRASVLENDVAVLVLGSSLSNTLATFNTNPNLPTVNTDLVSMGFGRTRANQGGGSDSLLKLDMEYVPDNACVNRYSEHDSGFNLCVDNNDGGICFGDSGGPIVDTSGVVYGVASFIIQSCDSNFPDFYTRGSSYSGWVQRQVCEQSENPPADIDCTNIEGPDSPDDDDSGGFLIDLLIGLLDFITGLFDIFFG